jgi:indole-3-glycerol phosphate synthase
MNILDKIIERKRSEIKELHKKHSLSDFSDSAYFSKSCLSLFEKIKDEKNISIIAEVKKASPSKGIIREDFNHLDIAKVYLESGASAISVLTDEQFFQGSIQFLKDIAEIKTIPILRKDFIIDIFQIYEAKANGADAILLISEVLKKEEIEELTLSAKELGLEVLLEVHSEAQLEKINFGINHLIGINNRNLSNFVTDLKATLELSNCIPEDAVIVSESGINNKESIEKLKPTRVKAVLVGEYFMRMPHIHTAFEQFRQWCIK